MIESAWIGESTETSSCVCVCVNVAGTVTLSGNGFAAPVPQTADPIVNNGVVRFDVTGLTENQSYPATVTFTGGNSIDVTMKTVSTEKMHVVVFSCTDSTSQMKHSWDNLRENIEKLDAPVLILSIGDFGYADNSIESYGSLSTLPSVRYNAWSDSATYQDQYIKTHRIMRMLPWVADIIRHNPIYFMLDDHDVQDGWDWSLLEINRSFQDNGAPSVEQISDASSDADKILRMRNIYDLTRSAWNDFSQGNPANSDADLDTYPAPAYFRQRIGLLLELFVIDAISYRNPKQQGVNYTEPETIYIDGVDKTMFGDTGKGPSVVNSGAGGKQLPWLKTQTANSESAGVSHKIIACSKKTHPNANDNQDNMGFWSYERDRVLKSLADNSITSIVWGTGDRHDPSVIYRHGDETIDSVVVDLNHICVSSCPIGRNQVAPLPAGGVGYEPGVIWKRAGYSGDYSPWNNNYRCYSIATITEDKQTWRVYDSQESGHYVWEGYVNAGENVLTYNKQKFT